MVEPAAPPLSVLERDGDIVGETGQRERSRRARAKLSAPRHDVEKRQSAPHPPSGACDLFFDLTAPQCEVATVSVPVLSSGGEEVVDHRAVAVLPVLPVLAVLAENSPNSRSGGRSSASRCSEPKGHQRKPDGDLLWSAAYPSRLKGAISASVSRARGHPIRCPARTGLGPPCRRLGSRRGDAPTTDRPSRRR